MLTPFEDCLAKVKRKHPYLPHQEQVNMANYCLKNPNYNKIASKDHNMHYGFFETTQEEKQIENEVELDNPIRQLCFSELIIFVHKHE